MPTPKEMEKLASTGGAASKPLGPRDDMPAEYWGSVANDPRFDAEAPGPSIRTQRLAEISGHLLRVSCARCGRIVEIQKADAARLYGLDAVWKEVGQRLLDNTCQQRTGRYEEDGCWPRFE
jgi:hypothetical protein